MKSAENATTGALQTSFETVVLDWAGVTRKRLFGFPAYRVEGRLFAVLDADGIAITRLPETAAERLAEVHETGPFEAYGQTIVTWEYVTADVDDLASLVPFVEESYDAARSETRSVPPPDETE